VQRALAELVEGIDDAVRTRIHVTDVRSGEEVGRAHAASFSEARPAATMGEESRPIAPEMLAEVEAASIVPEVGGQRGERED
jgi:enamine deaminase RidA (YjgF/YER057c/UK114 family)